MKDFDAEQAERERDDDAYAFTLRGETFYRRRRVSLKEARDADTILDSDEDSYAAMIRQTLTYIEDRDDAHARLRAMTERDENCLGLGDLFELRKWLVEEESGLPTIARSALANGRASATRRSTAKSSSTVAPG